MSFVKQLAGQTAIYGISHILGRVLHYVLLTFYLTRVLSQAEFGMYNDLYAWAALLLILLTYRMETAFFRFGNKKEARAAAFGTGATSILVSTLLFAAVALTRAPTIAAWLAYPDKAAYVRLFALILAFDALAALPFARLRLEGRPGRFALLKVCNILINIFFVLFFLEACPRLQAAGHAWVSFYDASDRLWYVFLSNLLASAATLALLLPAFRQMTLRVDGALWKRMMRWAFPLVIVGLAGVVNQSIAVPLQKWRLGENLMHNLAQAGVYAAAAKLALLMNLFAVAFNFAAEPFFFSHAERADARTIYSDVAHAFTIAACTLLLALTGWIELVQYLLGADFRAAIHLVPVLLFAYLMLGLYYNFSIWYKLSDHTWYGAGIAAGGAVVTFAINWFLLPQMGYAASAWAALTCYAFMNAACLWLGRRHFPVPYRLPRMAGYLLLALALVALMQWGRAMWPMPLPWRLVLHSALVVLFLATAWRTDHKALLRYWKG